jgi:cytoskeletal protein CcmA (bactofilin family)
MLGFRRKRSSRANGKLTAFIDEGSEIEGKYTFSGTVMLNGKFSGEIVSTDTLIIGEKGVVHACIQAGAVLISGEVVGNVVASQRVDLRAKARVVGDIDAPVVVLEEGVLFEGQCRMNKSRPAEQAPMAPLSRDLSAVPVER